MALQEMLVEAALPAHREEEAVARDEMVGAGRQAQAIREYIQIQLILVTEVRARTAPREKCTSLRSRTWDHFSRLEPTFENGNWAGRHPRSLSSNEATFR